MSFLDDPKLFQEIIDKAIDNAYKPGGIYDKFLEHISTAKMDMPNQEEKEDIAEEKYLNECIEKEFDPLHYTSLIGINEKLFGKKK